MTDTNEKDLIVLQLNLHKCKTASANHYDKLRMMAQNKFSFISAVQEPHAYSNKLTHKITGLQYYQPSKNIRTAIIASPDMNVWPMPEFTEGDITTVLAQTNNLQGKHTIFI